MKRLVFMLLSFFIVSVMNGGTGWSAESSDNGMGLWNTESSNECRGVQTDKFKDAIISVSGYVRDFGKVTAVDVQHKLMEITNKQCHVSSSEKKMETRKYLIKTEGSPDGVSTVILNEDFKEISLNEVAKMLAGVPKGNIVRATMMGEKNYYNAGSAYVIYLDIQATENPTEMSNNIHRTQTGIKEITNNKVITTDTWGKTGKPLECGINSIVSNRLKKFSPGDSVELYCHGEGDECIAITARPIKDEPKTSSTPQKKKRRHESDF